MSTSSSPIIGVRRLLVALLALVLLSTGCAATASHTTTWQPSADELAELAAADSAFEASPGYLARVSSRADLVDTARFELFMTFDASVFTAGSRTEPLMSGAISGGNTRTYIDLGLMSGPFTALNDGTMNMTMVTTDQHAYLNAPFLATVAGFTGLAETDLAWTKDLATGWGRLDLGDESFATLGDLGLSAFDGDSLVELLENTGNVIDGGSSEVRGVPVRVAHAEVSVLDLLETAVQDVGLSDSDRDALSQSRANIAVSIDDEGMVRRIEYTIDFAALIEQEPELAGFELKIWQRLDYYDYGEPVDVYVPSEYFELAGHLEDLENLIGD